MIRVQKINIDKIENIIETSLQFGRKTGGKAFVRVMREAKLLRPERGPRAKPQEERGARAKLQEPEEGGDSTTAASYADRTGTWEKMDELLERHNLLGLNWGKKIEDMNRLVTNQ